MSDYDIGGQAEILYSSGEILTWLVKMSGSCFDNAD